MRQVTYSAACSLDGFIAGPEGETDWIRPSREAREMLAQTWRGLDAIIMGRRTFEMAMKAGAPTHDAITTYVFSRTLTELESPGRELVREDAAAFVRRLKAQPGGGVFLMGGGELAATLLDAGLVDRIQLHIHSILLGGGARLFGALSASRGLRLLEARPTDSGGLLAVYEPEA